MAVFTLQNLIPDFCQLPTMYVNQVMLCESVKVKDAEVVSAVIVAILIVIFFFFLGSSLIKFFRSGYQIKFYSKLLRDVSIESLASKQSQINKEAKKNKYFRALWEEFDESLVKHKVNGVDRLSNTLDAAHFFNTHSLAKGLTENRLLAAIPGLLTAIGVIGTFAGLQMGLAGINLTSDDIAPLKDGIGNMIKGASIAFLTSLWGIFLSVVFNIFEKFIERNLRRKISNLQNRIDFLYPRLTAEQSLVEIADTSKIAAVTMQGLSEQIGSKMQEAMATASESISNGLKESLRDVLAPALEKMAADAHTGSEKALESMLERFMSGFGEAGKDQREMMDNSSRDVQKSIGQLGTQMNGFIAGLDERSNVVDENNRKQREYLEQMLRSYEENSNGRQQAMSAEVTSLMNEMSKGTIAQLEEQRKRDDERTQSFKAQLDDATKHHNSSLSSFRDGVSTQLAEQRTLDENRNERANQQVDSLRASQDDLAKRLHELIAYQQKSHGQLYEELTKLQQGFAEVTMTNKKAAEDIKASSETMQSSAVQLSHFGDKLKQSSDALDLMSGQAVSSTNELAQKNLDSVEKLENVLTYYERFGAEITKTAVTLKEATEHAESGFSHVDQHLQSFQKTMEQQADKTEQQMQELMTHFAEQVKAQTVERMQVWTDETSKYNSLMTKAINAIADVVDDIETKVGSS